MEGVLGFDFKFAMSGENHILPPLIASAIERVNLDEELPPYRPVGL